MTLIRIVLLLALGGAIAARSLFSQGPPEQTGEPAGSPEMDAATEPPASQPAWPSQDAPGWVRMLAVLAPIVGAIGLGVSLLAMVASQMGWELPEVGAVTGNWPLGLFLISIGIWAVWLLWQVPRWQAASWRRHSDLSEREVFDIENSSRGTLGQILSGVAVLAGLIFAWQQLSNTAQTLHVSQEGQITDRFSRAVNQLGDDDLTIRLGGIYALERIARDSERDHETIMEILAAFARQRSAAEAAASAAGPGLGTPVANPADGSAVLPSVRAIPLDIDVVLKVISRRDSSRDGPDCINLNGLHLINADLRGYDFQHVCLQDAKLQSANLAGANLTGADLTSADLTAANLDGATLVGAQLTGSTMSRTLLGTADLTGAVLTGANLQFAQLQATLLHDAVLNGTDLSGAVIAGADLQGANLLDANLTNAVLSGVNLRQTTNLTLEQVDSAIVDRTTQLPPDIPATPDF